MDAYAARASAIGAFRDGIAVCVQEVIEGAATSDSPLSADEVRWFRSAVDSDWAKTSGGDVANAYADLSGLSATNLVEREEEVVGNLPAYRAAVHLLGPPDTTFPSESERLYTWSGEISVVCFDERRAGERVVYAMAEAARRCLQNRRVNSNNGSFVLYSPRQGDVIAADNQVSVEVYCPIEFRDRR